MNNINIPLENIKIVTFGASAAFPYELVGENDEKLQKINSSLKTINKYNELLGDNTYNFINVEDPVPYMNQVMFTPKINYLFIYIGVKYGNA